MSTVLRDVRIGPSGPIGDVLIVDGRIASVGTRVDPKEESSVVTGSDLTVLPGLVDAHVHLTQWALARRRVDVSAAQSPEDVVEIIAQELRNTPRPGDELVTAYGFRSAAWTHQPSGDMFERALPGRQILAISNDLHTAWLSPRARLSIDHPVPRSGVVFEAEALELMARLTDVPVQNTDQWAIEALHAAAARGVTRLIDFEVADNLTIWARRAATEILPVHVVATVYPEYLEAAVAAHQHTGDAVQGTSGRVTVGPLKLFVDGSLNAKTALCHKPFVGSTSHGLLVTPEPVLRELVAKAHQAGISAAIHAIGDHAASVALATFETVECSGRIEHAQLMSHADIRRMADLGLVAGIQPKHALDDQTVTEQLWGDRLLNAFPHGALWRSGVPIEIGSDAPVSPLDPWLGVAAAVHRSVDGETPWQPDQRIPLPDALAAASGGKRSLHIGEVADLVVIRGDPALMSPGELAAPEVITTIAGGHLTWADGAPVLDRAHA